MRNRAKCAKCDTIIESKHRHDYVSCKCGAIAVDGGDAYWRMMASDPSDFLRMYDDDTFRSYKDLQEERQKEAAMAVPAAPAPEFEAPLNFDQLMFFLTERLRFWDELPPGAKAKAVDGYDLYHNLFIVKDLLLEIQRRLR
jgi:hypothetical protein